MNNIQKPNQTMNFLKAVLLTYMQLLITLITSKQMKRCMGRKYVDLDPILAELAREGRIRISREVITLPGR